MNDISTDGTALFELSFSSTNILTIRKNGLPSEGRSCQNMANYFFGLKNIRILTPPLQP